MAKDKVRASSEIPALFITSERRVLTNGLFAKGYVRTAYFAFYRHGSLIFQTKSFVLNSKEFPKLVGDISIDFPEKPSIKNLALYVVMAQVNDGKIITNTVNLNPVVNMTFGKTPKKVRHSGYALAIGFKYDPKVISSKVIKLNLETSSKVARSSEPRSKRAPGSVMKTTPRTSPEITRSTYTVKTDVGWKPPTSVVVPFDTSYRTWTGVRTPGFKLKARTGSLPNNPYSMYRAYTAGGPYSNHKLAKPSGFSNQDGSMIQFGTLTAMAPANHLAVDTNLIISKLSAKINSSQANLPEDLIQWHQTMRLFTSKTRQIATFGRLLGIGQPKRAARVLNIPFTKRFKAAYREAVWAGKAGSELLASLWLEYRYGVLPLIGDIEAALGAMNQIVKNDPDIRSVSSSRAEKSATKSEQTGIATTCNPCPVIFTTTDTTTVVRIGLTYKLDDRLLNLAAGFGFTAPIALAWELVPFSFVVDWFLPIGQALTAFSAFEGLVFKKGYQTTFTRQRVQRDASYSGSNASYSSEIIQGTITFNAVRMSRVGLTSFPSPKLPQVKNPFTVIHAANAAALVVAVFSRTTGPRNVRNFSGYF